MHLQSDESGLAEVTGPGLDFLEEVFFVAVFFVPVFFALLFFALLFFEGVFFAAFEDFLLAVDMFKVLGEE